MKSDFKVGELVKVEDIDYVIKYALVLKTEGLNKSDCIKLLTVDGHIAEYHKSRMMKPARLRKMEKNV